MWGPGEDGESDAVDVLLNGGGDDHLRGLSEAGVDDLHAGVAEGTGDDLCATVVAVEAGFGDQNTDWRSGCHRLLSISGYVCDWVPPSPLRVSCREVLYFCLAYAVILSVKY